jgi:hypothetical protein
MNKKNKNSDNTTMVDNEPTNNANTPGPQEADPNVVNAIATAAEENTPAAPTAPAPPKKRPGRPRKNIENTPAEILGIVDTPSNPEHLVEIVYNNPKMFKKINVIYKNYTSSEICFHFTPTTTTFMTVDRFKKNDIYTTLDGNCFGRYFCAQPITIWVKRESIDKIFAALDDNYGRITFVLRNDYRSRFYILVHDIEYDSIDTYAVEVICKPNGIEYVEKRDDNAYPIKFTLSGKYFKKKISDIGKISESLTIIKEGNNPLQLTYDESKMINYNGVYPNSEKISLDSSIPLDDTFSVSVLVGYIKPFSNANIGGNVRICASKTDKLSLSTQLGKTTRGFACEVKVFTEIKQQK